MVSEKQSLHDVKSQVKGFMRRPLSSGAYFDTGFKARHKPSTQSHEYSATRNLAMVTSAQARRIPSAKPVTVSVHADMLKVKLSDYDTARTERDTWRGGSPVAQISLKHGGVIGLHLKRQGATQRGIISGFSRASRKRMIETMASIRHQGSMLFLTMTYDDESLCRDDLDFKAEFEAFRRRFERAFPSWQALWRIELQTRKSGLLLGCQVPHYHLLIFTEERYEQNQLQVICESFTSWGCVVWQEITTSFDPAHIIYGFHCSPVKSRKQAMHYVSKYVGKSAEDNVSIGRRWGRIGTLDCSGGEVFHLDEEEYIVFRRLVKRWLRNRSLKFSGRFARSSAGSGCTVFGLGDSSSSTNQNESSTSALQFVTESRRQVRERRERESGKGT